PRIIVSLGHYGRGNRQFIRLLNHSFDVAIERSADTLHSQLAASSLLRAHYLKDGRCRERNQHPHDADDHHQLHQGKAVSEGSIALDSPSHDMPSSLARTHAPTVEVAQVILPIWSHTSRVGR